MHARLLASLQTLKTGRFWWRQLLALLRGLVLVTVLLYFTQRSYIYHPTPMAQADFDAAVHKMYPQSEVLQPFQAIVVEPPAGQPVRATAVFFHGNSGLGGGRGVFAPTFIKRGIRLVFAEYPGFGPREAEELSEKSIVADARALYGAVRKRYPDSPVMLVGESLGSGPASLVAANPGAAPPPERLVLLTPYRSMAETAARTMWMLPVRHLVKDVYDAEGALPRYTGPLSILVAGQDEVVGAAQGQHLAKQARLRTPTFSYVELPTAGHNTWRFDIKPEQWSQLLGLEPVALP